MEPITNIEEPTAVPTGTQQLDTPEQPVEGVEGQALTPPSTPPETPPPPKPTSAQIAAHLREKAQLLRTKEELNNRQQAWEQQQASLQEQTAQVNGRIQAFQSILAEFEENPVAWLQKHKGFGPDEYYKAAMNGGPPPKEHLLERKLQTLEEKLQAEEQWRTNWLKEQETGKQAAAETAKQQALAAEYETASTAFLAEASRFPVLASMFDADTLLEEAGRYVNSLGPKAANISYTDIATEFNARAEAWLAHARAAVEPPATQAAPSTEPQEAPAKSAQSAPVKKAKVTTKVHPAGEYTPQTLTQGISGTRANIKTPTTAEDFEEVKRQLKNELGS